MANLSDGEYQARRDEELCRLRAAVVVDPFLIPSIVLFENWLERLRHDFLREIPDWVFCAATPDGLKLGDSSDFCLLMLEMMGLPANGCHNLFLDPPENYDRWKAMRLFMTAKAFDGRPVCEHEDVLAWLVTKMFNDQWHTQARRAEAISLAKGNAAKATA